MYDVGFNWKSEFKNEMIYIPPKIKRHITIKYRLPFETGCASWRWYHKFLHTHEDKMIFPVMCDTNEILMEKGLVMC
jgi:hypothetical protein